MPAYADKQKDNLKQPLHGDNSAAKIQAEDPLFNLRVRKIIGELYSEQFDILLFLTLFYYLMITARDIFTDPPASVALLVVDGLIILLLLAVYFLERRGVINTSNIYLTPIPIAIAMLVNGYMHIYVSDDPLTFVKGIMMTVAFGIVSLLPWIFWFLLLLSTAFFVVTAVLMLGGDSTSLIFMALGAGMISYGSFAMRYNSVRKQISLTIINEQRADALEVANAAKDRFVANVSHELRTPLTGLVGMLDLMDLEGLDGEQKKQMKIAQSSAESLGEIINDLLDVASLDAGKITLKTGLFDLAQTVSTVISTVQSQASESVTLKCNMPEQGIPRLEGDGSRIRQILFNLVGNAVKFTEAGSVMLTVSIQAVDKKAKVRCEVQDTGPGIPASKLASLFDRFEMVDTSATRTKSGTGLGLAIAQDLAGLMGSSIKVESQLGKGSRFWFDLELPLAPEPKHGRADDADGMPKDKSEQAKGFPLKFLLAEDNKVNQLLISRLIDQPGWYCDVVSNGREAVAAAEKTKFDIIIMDIQMPEMNGEAATQKIRAGGGLNQDTPILALTANCHAGDIERYWQIGISAHVPKPINIPEFFNTIEDLIVRE